MKTLTYYANYSESCKWHQKTAGLPMNKFLKVVLVGLHDYTVFNGFQKPVHIATSGLDMKDQRFS
jgi:hypothetical protein